MKPPCEIVVNRVIPCIRAYIVNALVTEHGMKQTEVAKKLGITQASVSQYLSNTRAADKAIVKAFPEIKKNSRKIADKISNGTPESHEIIGLVCDMCAKIRKNKKFCSYHRTFAQLEKCRICF